jgi:predicted NUDIX family NTP pyrophosphohydrolase
MPRKQSAGTLLYRQGENGLEVLLVHPSGPYNRRAPWSIPKGVPNDGESDLERTARRETLEEVGIMPDELFALGYIEYRKSHKDVYCFAGPAPVDAEARPTSWEVDQARFIPMEEARRLLHPDQVPFLDRLAEYLQKRSATDS